MEMIQFKIFRPVSLLAVTGFLAALGAETVPVPNASFELPRVDAVLPLVDSWQKMPKPDWYNEAQNGPWEQLVGVFKNTAPTSNDHIPKMDGDQALYLFNSPQAGLFQDGFNATFETGKTYTLTVGVIGGGGSMTNGASLLMSLYYRDAASNSVTVAAKSIVHSTNLFPTTTHLVDIELTLPVVTAADAWAGKDIGIGFVSASGFETAGGYWDIDDVRLTKIENIALPNASFELPRTDSVLPFVDSWRKAPKPDWFDESQNGPWDQLIGVFHNTLSTSPDHIPNMHGDQAIYLFNSPQAGFFQDGFDATFEPGKAYTLTAGVIGGGGSMTNGASLLMSLYFRDASSNIVTIASRPIVHSTNLFPTTTHLVDLALEISTVKASDPWAGKNIGVIFAVTSGFDTAGGYWDLDNVRLAAGAVSGPALKFAREGSNLRFSWPSQLGRSYQLQVSRDLTAWTDYQSATIGSGAELSKVVPIEIGNAFFKLVEL